MDIMNKENKQFSDMYVAGQNTGTRKMKNFADDKAPLINGKMIPYYRMQHNWGFEGGSNIEFKNAEGHQGYLEYTPQDGSDPVRIDFNTINQAFPGGEGYFGAVTQKTTKDKMNVFWNSTKSIYTNVAPSKDFDKTETSEGYVQSRVTSYQNAEEAYVTALDENKNFLKYWGEITQNDWQVMGFESEFHGTPQEIEDFKDEVLMRTSETKFKRDKVEDKQQEGWRTALSDRLSKYRTSGIGGFPAEFPKKLQKFTGAIQKYDDVVMMSEEIAASNEIPSLVELLNKMSASTTKKKFMTGTQVEEEIIQSLDNFWNNKNNEWPAGVTQNSTWRQKLDAAAGEKENPYFGINPSKYDNMHSEGTLFVKNTDNSFPNEIIGIHTRSGGHDAKAIESLILEQSKMSRTELNAIQSGAYGPTGDISEEVIESTTTAPPRVYEGETAEDKIRIENRELGAKEAFKSIQQGQVQGAVNLSTSQTGTTQSYQAFKTPSGTNVAVSKKGYLEDKDDGSTERDIAKVLNWEKENGYANMGFTGGGGKPKGVANKEAFESVLAEVKNQNPNIPAEEATAIAAEQTVSQYIVGDGSNITLKGGNTLITSDLGIDRSEFDKLPGDLKHYLIDYKMNSGRSSKDFLMILNGDWNGVTARKNYSDLTKEEKDKYDSFDFTTIDLTTVTPRQMEIARRRLYQDDGTKAFKSADMGTRMGGKIKKKYHSVKDYPEKGTEAEKRKFYVENNILPGDTINGSIKVPNY